MKKILQSKVFLTTIATAWFLAVAIPIGYLMGFHQAFSNTTKANRLAEVVKDQRIVLHLIGADCLCSDKLANHLIKRLPLKNISEKIIVVGDNPGLEKKLAVAGFEVEKMSADLAFTRYSIKALPQMIIFDSHKPVYSGGYSAKRSPASEEDYDDLRIIDQFFKGTFSESRPIFGCANGAMLRSKIDPLKMKY
ncbi:MAG: hypothetical protein K2Q18_12595 [Bdellovibrionales bacterium]|nr:hypothetical protein [Bdellovibrionales bacterium]